MPRPGGLISIVVAGCGTSFRFPSLARMDAQRLYAASWITLRPSRTKSRVGADRARRSWLRAMRPSRGYTPGRTTPTQELVTASTTSRATGAGSHAGLVTLGRCIRSRPSGVDLDALRIDTGELARNLSREDLYLELADMAVREICPTAGKQSLLIALAFHRLSENGFARQSEVAV